MPIIKKILLWLGALILLFIAILVTQVVLIQKPTHGNKIAQYTNPQKAVLVIDIQEDFTGDTAKPPFPYKDSEKLITTVNTITDAASRNNIIIIYIRQELDGFWGKFLSNILTGGTVIKGQPGTAIDKRVAVLSENIFPKPQSDAFSNSIFEKFLIENQVNELYLVGLDAAGCVHNTAKGALSRGYAVNIITDSIVLREENKWDKLLECYKAEGITLITSADFMAVNP